jgi:hypothetical protein
MRQKREGRARWSREEEKGKARQGKAREACVSIHTIPYRTNNRIPKQRISCL